MTDLAAALAQDVFNRIEREHKCQLHIIEDELRCRLGAAHETPVQAPPPSSPEKRMCEDARDLCRSCLNDPVAYAKLPYTLQATIDQLYHELHLIGWI